MRSVIAVVVASVCLASPASAAEGRWASLADQVYQRAVPAYAEMTAADENVPSMWVAGAAWYAGMRYGWQSDEAQLWLQRVYDRRTASGGYGVGEWKDYFNDGTWNPPDTTYGITTAWHVGRVLIDGYDGGGVPRVRVLEAATALMDFPEVADGQCIAYSKHVNDSTEPCVWNVSATAAWFLWRAYQRGIFPADREAEMLEKVRTWRNYVRGHYDYELRGWNYMEGAERVLDDPGHLGATVSAMYEADPSIGEPALTAYWDHYLGAVSPVDLVIYDCSKADATYQPVHDFALGGPDTAAEHMARAVYAPVSYRVHTTCCQPFGD